jgi:hypothetical protein
MGKKKKKTQLVNKDLEQMSERHQSIELKRRRKTTDNNIKPYSFTKTPSLTDSLRVTRSHRQKKNKKKKNAFRYFPRSTMMRCWKPPSRTKKKPKAQRKKKGKNMCA